MQRPHPVGSSTQGAARAAGASARWNLTQGLVGSFRQGLLDSVPVASGIAAYGIVFGTLSADAGLSALDVLAMSALVFSGSAQFAGLPLLKAGVGPGQLFAATFMLSLRHLVMGLSLAPMVKGRPLLQRLVLAFCLNDESYGLTTARAVRTGFSPGYLLATGAATFAAWVGSTVTGAVLARAFAFSGATADPARWGLDFAFPAVFIALLVPQVRGRASMAAAAAGMAAGLGAAPFLDTGGLVLAGAVAAGAVWAYLDRVS